MRKIPFAGIELTSQRVRGLRGTSELPGRPATCAPLFSHTHLWYEVGMLIECVQYPVDSYSGYGCICDGHTYIPGTAHAAFIVRTGIFNMLTSNQSGCAIRLASIDWSMVITAKGQLQHMQHLSYVQVFSTCSLLTNSGCGIRLASIDWSVVITAKRQHTSLELP